jgi:hypothetical protein
MILFKLRSLINLRSASVRRRSGPSSRRRAWRVAPRLLPLELRVLLSTITVTNDNDNGSGSLRGALAAAVAGDTIKFAPSAYGTITLSSAPLEVTSSVTIMGPGAKDVTINGNNTFQDLLVDANVTARVSGLTITGGKGPATYPYGGGIFNNGTLTVANCVITNNSAGEYGAGGGIDNNGSLTVTNSIVSNNTADFGAGISNNSTGILEITGSTISNNTVGTYGEGGGLSNLGMATITSSVVSNNSAGGGGGGITDSSFSAGGGTLAIKNSVVSNNSAPGGGGGLEAGSFCTVTIINSTIANNSAGGSDLQFGLGGGINAFGSVSLNISGSVFADNTAVSSDFGDVDGGAIFMTNFGLVPSATLNVSNSSFLGNSVVGFQAFGGAIHVDPGVNVAVTGTSFSGNTATGDLEAQGGAVDLVTSFGNQATVIGSTFQGNGAIVPATSPFAGGSAKTALRSMCRIVCS